MRRIGTRPVRPRTGADATGAAGNNSSLIQDLHFAPGLENRRTDRQDIRMSRPIQLHADLAIDPAREAEAIHYFETVYRPTARTFEGYIDLQLLRLAAALAGTAPAGINYRFSITFTTEALRRQWVASDAHQEVWGRLE